jgi:hypothetical protein
LSHAIQGNSRAVYDDGDAEHESRQRIGRRARPAKARQREASRTSRNSGAVRPATCSSIGAQEAPMSWLAVDECQEFGELLDSGNVDCMEVVIDGGVEESYR